MGNYLCPRVFHFPQNNGAVETIANHHSQCHDLGSRSRNQGNVCQHTPGNPAKVYAQGDGLSTTTNQDPNGNTNALGFVTKNLQPKATESADTKYWFVKD
jgi:hypothetical protein